MVSYIGGRLGEEVLWDTGAVSEGADYRPGNGSSKALDDGTAAVDLDTAGSVARTLDLCVCVFMRRWRGFLENQLLIHGVLQRVHFVSELQQVKWDNSENKKNKR